MKVLGRFLVALFAVVGMLLVAGCGSDGPQPPPGAELPEDFPLVDVPLVEGTVQSADGNRGDGWRLIVQGSAAQTDHVEAAVNKLTAAGYEESSRVEEGGGTAVVLSGEKSGDTYWVQVGVTSAAAGGDSSVFYNVTVQ